MNSTISLNHSFKLHGMTHQSSVLKQWCLVSIPLEKITMFLKKVKSTMLSLQLKVLTLNHGSMRWILLLCHTRLPFSQSKWTVGHMTICLLLMMLTVLQELRQEAQLMLKNKRQLKTLFKLMFQICNLILTLWDLKQYVAMSTGPGQKVLILWMTSRQELLLIKCMMLVKQLKHKFLLYIIH